MEIISICLLYGDSTNPTTFSPQLVGDFCFLKIISTSLVCNASFVVRSYTAETLRLSNWATLSFTLDAGSS